MSTDNGSRSVAPWAGSERGFSLVEVLIASGIFLIIVIGILPLFTRAMIDNTAGADYTTASNMAKSAQEQRVQLRLNDAAISPVGAATSLQTYEFWNTATKKWAATGTSSTVPANSSWRRRATVRQFRINDLDDDNIFDDPEPGTTEAKNVHIKEVEVRVESVSTNGGPLGPRRRTTVRYLKAY